MKKKKQNWAIFTSTSLRVNSVVGHPVRCRCPECDFENNITVRGTQVGAVNRRNTSRRAE